MKIGDSIYYINQAGDTCPGIILDIKKRYKISCNEPEGDKIRWVPKKSLFMQEIIDDFKDLAHELAIGRGLRIN